MDMTIYSDDCVYEYSRSNLYWWKTKFEPLKYHYKAHRSQFATIPSLRLCLTLYQIIILP